jgi:hypothetical protein
LYSEELQTPCHNSRRVAGNVDAHEKRNSNTALAVKHEGKRLLEHPGINWDDTIKMELKWKGGDDVINFAQNRNQWKPLVNMAMNLQVS